MNEQSYYVLVFCFFMVLAGLNIGNAIFRKSAPEWLRVLVFGIGVFCLSAAMLNFLELCHG